MYDYNKKLIFITVVVVVAVMVVILALFSRNTQTASSTSSAASSSSIDTSTVEVETEIEQLCVDFYEATMAGDSEAQEEAYNKMNEHFQADPTDTEGQNIATGCISEALAQVSPTDSATPEAEGTDTTDAESTENTDTEEASTSGELVE